MSEEPKKVLSAINQMAAMRVSQRLGPNVLKLFLELESALRESGGSSFTGGVQFNEPGDHVQEGELIPSVHFSLNPHCSILSIPIEIEDEDDVRPDNNLPSGEPASE